MDYSGLTIHYNGTANGNSFNLTQTYQVILYTATGYKVNITLSSGGNVVHYEAFVWKNGTAAWVFYNGSNNTGIYATFAYFGAVSGFLLESAFTNPATLAQITSSGFVHVVSQSTVMIGPTSVMVTTYAPNSLPLVFQSCGTSANFSNFTIQVGTVTGKSQNILTKLQITGTFSSGGTTQSLNFTIQVTSVTKA
jgi:hypothetical protein